MNRFGRFGAVGDGPVLVPIEVPGLPGLPAGAPIPDDSGAGRRGQILTELAAAIPNASLFQSFRYLSDRSEAAPTDRALRALADEVRASYETNTSPEERARDAAGELAQGRILMAKLLQSKPSPDLLAIARRGMAKLQLLADGAEAELARARARTEEIRKRGTSRPSSPTATPRPPAADAPPAPAVLDQASPRPSFLKDVLTFAVLTSPAWLTILLYPRREP